MDAATDEAELGRLEESVSSVVYPSREARNFEGDVSTTSPRLIKDWFDFSEVMLVYCKLKLE